MDATTRFRSVFNADFSETVAYNNPLFPAYTVYGFLSCYPGHTCISHWHKDLEFVVIKKGSMTYNVNGRLIELTEGNGIMVNGRQFHYGFSTEHDECEFACILLSPELLQANDWFYQNCIEPITENSSYPYLYLENNGWMAEILDKLEKIFASFDGMPIKTLSYFEVMEKFFEIMKILYNGLDIDNRIRTPESSDLFSLRSMITYVEEHYMEHITLADIAAAGVCCKSKCSQLFRKYLCDTPIIYTTKLRLNKSLSALLNSDSSITRIACEYGFSGASYYCETFKKYYGLPPLVYRKNQPALQ